jgi:S1-C subfamily serine protease
MSKKNKTALVLIPFFILFLIGFFIHMDYAKRINEENNIANRLLTWENSIDKGSFVVYNYNYRVESGASSGTAFMISDDLLFTSEHVVIGLDKVFVEALNKKVYEATVVYRDDTKDIAILKTEEPILAVSPVNLSCRDPIYNEEVLIVGNPSTVKFLTTRGRVAGIIGDIEKNLGNVNVKEMFVVDATMSPGMSGGPSFNKHGEVIGINFAVITAISDVNRPVLTVKHGIPLGIIIGGSHLCAALEIYKSEVK